MKVRSTAIVEAFQITDFKHETLMNLVRWMFNTGGDNVLTEKHGSHLHIVSKKLDLQVSQFNIWLVYSDGQYFGFTDSEFNKHYEPLEKAKVQARITVQTQKEFIEGATGTIFQALVNSGLSRDQALDGLVEIQGTGVGFFDKSEAARSRLTWQNSIQPRCMRCTQEQVDRYGIDYHETAEHDQWYKAQLNKETNNA